MREEVRWISFHSYYDFGYLIKLLTHEDMPIHVPPPPPALPHCRRRTPPPLSVLHLPNSYTSTHDPHQAGQAQASLPLPTHAYAPRDMHPPS
jgi:hypothetical protein